MTQRPSALFVLFVAFASPVWTALACTRAATSGDDDSVTPTGGTTTSGGATSTGGSTATGGTTSAGGTTATGGTTSTGGSTATGGTTSAGGTTATGGTTSTGGTATGGTTSTGGTATGGATTGGATATGGTTSTGGSVATGGGAGAVSGGAAGTPGAAGAAAVKDCFTKVTPAKALLTDFESYDGTLPAFGDGSWTFSIGTTAYAGLYALSESSPPGSATRSATYTLNFAAGASASNWAAHAANTATADWGGGIGLWMGCIDASSFAGLTFWVRGTTPTGMLTVAFATEDTTPPDAADARKGGTCDPPAAGGCKGPSATVAITADWTQVSLPWAMWTAGVGASGVAVPATGDKLTGISFSAGMSYVANPADDGGTYLPEAGAFDVAIDNLGFL